MRHFQKGCEHAACFECCTWTVDKTAQPPLAPPTTRYYNRPTTVPFIYRWWRVVLNSAWYLYILLTFMLPIQHYLPRYPLRPVPLFILVV